MKRYLGAGALVVALGLLAAMGWSSYAEYRTRPAGWDGLHPSVKAASSSGCDKIFYCGALVAVSCQPELDGPVNYFNNDDGTLIMGCGGVCMSRGPVVSKRCTACPPPEWTCARPN